MNIKQSEILMQNPKESMWNICVGLLYNEEYNCEIKETTLCFMVNINVVFPGNRQTNKHSECKYKV
jgi:hypothetical protein